MKKFLCLLAALFLLASCQMETPVTLDIDLPNVKLVSIKNLTTNEMLLDSSAFTDYSMSITEDTLLVKIVATDNADLHRVSLMGIGVDGKEFILHEFKEFSQDTLQTTISSYSFPASQEVGIRKVKLFVRAQDKTENISAPGTQYGFNLSKVHPLEQFKRQLGNYTPVGAGYEINFASKMNRLTFVHFHMVACLTCKEEAEDLQDFVYGSVLEPGIVSDTSKVYVASFGSDVNPEMNEEYISGFIRENGLTFDCFLDTAPEIKVQRFMTNNNYMPGDVWENGCIAFFPDGHFNEYRGSTHEDFKNWLNAVYQEFLSADNKNNGKGSK